MVACSKAAKTFRLTCHCAFKSCPSSPLASWPARSVAALAATKLPILIVHFAANAVATSTSAHGPTKNIAYPTKRRKTIWTSKTSPCNKSFLNRAIRGAWHPQIHALAQTKPTQAKCPATQVEHPPAVAATQTIALLAYRACLAIG